IDCFSTGNPEPGGSGTVIIEWIASLSLRVTTTTNNVAEYTGLIHGLRQANTNNFTPLHVVGDSGMILRQLRMYRPPRKQHLRMADCCEFAPQSRRTSTRYLYIKLLSIHY
ncbi:TPA: hypothetical protein N0F65_008916, partial [Lagenidium giganteum]